MVVAAVTVELAMVTVAVTAWGAYHAAIARRKKPTMTKNHEDDDDEWVRCLMDGNHADANNNINNKDMVAVQSLRNSIITSTLAGSFSVILFAAVAVAVFGGAASPEPASAAADRKSLETAGLGTAMASLGAAVMMSCQSVRFLGSVNVLINVPLPVTVTAVTAKYVARLLRAANGLVVGAWRCLYFALFLVLWMAAGPVSVLVTCFVWLPLHYCLNFESRSGVSRRPCFSDDFWLA